jgi:hypothetical protein
MVTGEPPVGKTDICFLIEVPMDYQDYAGFYYMSGFQFHILVAEGQLAAAVPDVPAGFEILLEPVMSGDSRGDRFRLRGGPLDGSMAEFLRGEAGTVRAIRVEQFELARLTPEQAAELPMVRRLIAPPFRLTPEKQAAFQSLLDETLARSGGGAFDYNLPYPKYEFVQYAMAQEVFIFHGSNNRAIEVFSPTRTSVELYDRRGIGNQQAVYGTHDGLWSMFFAVVDRPRLRGSIRNGVTYFHNRAGEQLAVYNFSINQEQLPEKPWTAGALYFLPRSSFERQMLGEQAYANEWTCPNEVRPLARLDVDPEDFPFLDQISGHDDGLLLRNDILAETLRSAALAANLEEACFTITVPASPEMAQALTEWVEIQKSLIPTAQFSVTEMAAGLKMTVNNLPPAYQQVYGESYRELLGRDDAGPSAR